jgi:hypothetical protein
MTPHPDSAITILLDSQAHDLALKFAAEQATPQRGKQVYLNTLAICAVNQWLKLLQIETAPMQSHFWNAGLRALLDIADLLLPKLGRLECRPIRLGQTTFATPTELQPDLIGCVVVQFEQDLSYGQLLGFVPTEQIGLPTGEVLEEVALSELQPLSRLIARLYESPSIAAQPAITTSRVSGGTNYFNDLSSTSVTHLSQWLQDTFSVGWRSLESLMWEAELSPAREPDKKSLRHTEKAKFPTEPYVRGKRLELGNSGETEEIALVVNLTPQANEENEVLILVHPLQSQYLPAGLVMALLDEMGVVIAEVKSSVKDNLIKRTLRGKPGERFSVKVTLEAAIALEHFTI